jgi:hypothetical protein
LRKAMSDTSDVMSREKLGHKLEAYSEEYAYYRDQILSNNKAYNEKFGMDLKDLNSTI